MPLFKRSIKLHGTISWLFVILTLPVMITFVVVSYRANTLVIEDYSSKFIAKSVADNISNAENLLNPIISTVRSASVLMRDQPGFFREESSGDYLNEIVAGNEAVYAAYAGFDDGSFRQVRRAVKGKPVLDKPIDPNTAIVARYLDNRKKNDKGVATDAYVFHSNWGTILGKDSGPASYDPRTRGWYKDALKAKGLIVSDVYPFASSGELGITIAAPIFGTGQNQVVGVFAVDLTLKTLSRYLSDNRVTPNSITIIADESGGVIAHPVLESGITQRGNELFQNRLDKLGDPRVMAALAQRLNGAKAEMRYVNNGVEYLSIFSPFPKDFKKPWELLTITPTDDFVGAIKETNRKLIIFGVLAFCIQLLLIYKLSKAISRPMERLASDVSSIREFRFDGIRAVESPVAEIHHLGKAVFMLTRALESFTSYVPRGLVQQLLDSGQGTRLGVESRYLTLMFTDLRDFSILCETEPSQQLLTRVSDYFSSVASAVEQEQGTVDKYIGDAVMAFWGAPNRVENHAYLACVAAVRSQRRMALRNAEWTKQGMPPLLVRIGIHSDAVLVGNVGSVERLSYTVMGDGVNIAARLEGVNKEMGTWVCVSHAVYREAGERLCLRPIDTVTVKGRKAELLIYELLAIRDGDAEVAPTPEQLEICSLTTEAYSLYSHASFEAAREAYRKVLLKFPNDGVAQRMLEKCEAAVAKAAAS